MDCSKFIFENAISRKAYNKALKTKAKFIKKFGDDTNAVYHLSTVEAPVIGEAFGVRNIVISDESSCRFNEKSLVIGNIRMGFGHYRISMAIASAAHSIGYEPYWFDLHSFRDTTCGKIIEKQNELYSLGSRLSQRFSLFNRLVWEPLNSEGFRKLTYNCSDQKTTELMTAVFRELPKDIPFVATHVWPSQAAVHAGLKNVVNAVPDNWPMGLHLSEGAIHTVQTPSSYLGYRALRGMDKKRQLKPMPKEAIVYTGHYIDHELVSNIEMDCAKRVNRLRSGKPVRWLMSVGGAGAQKEIFIAIIRKLLPAIKNGKAALMINVGDHSLVWQELVKEVPQMRRFVTEHFNDFSETRSFCEKAYDGNVKGIHAFCHDDIFAAVYSTNLLMRSSDILITKPSELAFYPVPKLMIKRVGGHEAWGAVRSAEIGDGTYECSTVPETTAMIDMIQHDGDIIEKMCSNILTAKKAGVYDGAYRAVELAVGRNT
ncbi:hypothetical protein [Ruminococcus sp.]|uniref:DUF6937 domain-containing protein n=1 Tax=Ruminococcus sp. TaxID=41978 RepID=UPI0025E98CFA|nr:hypothetical protein [Ruminococcus sp.]